MSRMPEDGKTSRRDFLKLASVCAPAAAGAAALSATATAAEAEASAEAAGGLRDTPHTRAYYESLRF